MKPLAKVASPAALAVLRQATAIAPLRKKASDGLLPSTAHLRLNPNSDHNTGLAVDLTHDPKNGIDCQDIFEKFKDDDRVEYLIFNKKIWSRKYAKQGNRKYTGSNPHTKHLHVSIREDKANDTSPWFWWIDEPKLVNQVVAGFSTPRRKKPAKVEPTPAHNSPTERKSNGTTKASSANLVSCCCCCCNRAVPCRRN
jgi:hypothetical protein